MKENHKNKEYPSLKLAYEQVKDVLSEQKAAARDYANRAVTMFVVSTAVAGIGLPLVFQKGIQQVHLWNIPVAVFAIIPMALYISICYYSYAIFKPHSFETLNNPLKIGEGILSLSEKVFLQKMLEFTKAQFRKNQDIIDNREKLLKQLVPMIWVYMFTILLWMGVFFSLTS